MNDKRQLAAMGAEMAEQQQQPLCMAKRIEELETQVRVMAELLRELRDGVEGEWCFPDDLDVRIDAALAGKLPAPVVPEGWQLVPVNPTSEMISAGNAALAYDCCSGTADEAWPAMLAAAPKPEAK